MSNPWPHELSLGDLYFSPVIPAVVLGFVLAGITALLLNRLKLTRWLYAPSYLFLAIWALWILLIDRLWIHF
ncbi:DUF1656 domain-containing protein [Nitratifractor sp.]